MQTQKVRYEMNSKKFTKIPTEIIGYWLTDEFIDNFSRSICLGKVSEPRFGMSTADNNKFVRNWHEVEIKKACLPNEKIENQRWFPYNNGGEFRKWYGNNYDFVNWKDNGKEMKTHGKPTIRNESFYFKKGITWTSISSGKLSVRYFDNGFLFSSAGFCLFSEENLILILGFLNSVVCCAYLKLFSPTLNFNVGSIALLPIIENGASMNVDTLVRENITKSKSDWDSFETSWDFKKHPLI